MRKLCSLKDAMALVPDGAMLALGGNTLNRAPMSAVLELIAQGRRGLRLVKTAGGLDVDALCLAGAVASVDAGFISCESEYGLCQHYRKAVQNGQVIAHEHACYTVISALRAASCGIGFMPVRGLQVSDLRRVNDYFSEVTDPFTGEKLAAVRALRPDVCVIHAQLADEAGNALIDGPKYDDVLMSRASAGVIVTAERIVGGAYFAGNERKADIPHFMVRAVCECHRGAAPGSCAGYYDPDDSAVRRMLALKDAEELLSFIHERRESL